MDLSIIQTHLDNFVDTWEGWNKIFSNLGNAFNNLVDAYFGFQSGEYELFENTSSVLSSAEPEAEAEAEA